MPAASSTPRPATPRTAVASHSARAHRRGHSAAVTAAVVALALSACSSDEATPEVDPTGGTTGATTGIPDAWAEGVAEGRTRYPDIGSVGMGDIRWDCPLTDSVDVDGETMTKGDTTFWKLADGVHEIECGFYPPTPVSLRYAEAEDDAAYAALEDSTGALEQQGNEQAEGEVTVGERTYTAVTWEFPTNPATGTRYVACYLDPDALTRACLDVSHSDERSKDYDVEQAVEELDAILSAAS